MSIPLHRSARWHDVVSGNIERLAPIASVVVSDVDGQDDTLDRLRRRFEGLPGVTFLEHRSVDEGWVAHSNDLLARVVTDYAMWLPHDDEIDESWITESEAILDSRPDVVATLGDVTGIFEPEGRQLDWALESEFSSADDGRRRLSALRAAVLGDTASLGVLYRAVLRTRAAPFLPRVPEGGEWVDILWAIRLVFRGPIARLPSARYRKRLYEGNTHGSWPNLRLAPEFRSRDIAAALAGLPPSSGVRLLADIWSEEVKLLNDQLVRAEATTRDVATELERVRKSAEDTSRALSAALADSRALLDEVEQSNLAHRDELVTLREAYESSTSWRLTRPLRALRRSQ